MTGFPEGVELWHIDVALRCLLTGDAVQISQPLHLRSALSKLCVVAESLGEPAIDIVIGSSLPDRIDRLLHSEVETVAGCRANIIAFQRRRTGKYDVRTPCRRGPPRLVDDNGFRLPPGTQEAIEVLNLVEGVATAPIDQSDVWIDQPVTVEIQGATRVQQHIAKPRRRDIRLHRIGTDRQLQQRQPRVWTADASCCAIAEPKATTRAPNLTQYGGK